MVYAVVLCVGVHVCVMCCVYRVSYIILLYVVYFVWCVRDVCVLGIVYGVHMCVMYICMVYCWCGYANI